MKIILCGIICLIVGNLFAISLGIDADILFDNSATRDNAYNYMASKSTCYVQDVIPYQHTVSSDTVQTKYGVKFSLINISISNLKMIAPVIRDFIKNNFSKVINYKFYIHIHRYDENMMCDYIEITKDTDLIEIWNRLK